MARPDFLKTWASSRLSIPTISDPDYALGFANYLGAIPPSTDDHDYIMNLQDQRAVWLGEQMLLAVGHQWQSDVTYDAYAVTRSPVDGQLYRSLVGGNLGNEPSVSGAQWSIGVVDAGSLPFGYFSGFTMANDGGAPNTTISVSAGAARGSLDNVDIRFNVALRGILQAAGAWAAGDNQNKLDTGAKANSTTYHVFVIRKTDDGTGDLLFSLSSTAPTVPTGYSGFRRIGRIATDGSGNIRAFKDRGNGRFDWVTPNIEATVTGIAPTTTLLTLSAFGGAPVEAILNVLQRGDGNCIKITASDVTDAATSTALAGYTGGLPGDAGGGSADEASGGFVNVMTDTSGQIRVRNYAAAGNIGYRVLAMGWREIR